MICLNSCRKFTIGFVAVVLILATGIYVGLNMLTPAPRETAPENIARPTIEAFLSIRLPDTQGVSRRVGDWKEKVLVVNFWASWCQPCREEMPAFSRLHTKYSKSGVQFIGIAVDNAKSVADFSDKLSVGYPLLIAETEGSDLMRQLGNSRMGLPYTVVIDRSGSIVMTRLGNVPEAQLDEFLGKVIRPSN